MVLDEGLTQYDDAEQSALDRLSSAKLSDSPMLPVMDTGNTFNGRIPANLSSRPPSDVGMYLELMTGYSNYVSWQKLLAASAMLAAKEKLALTEAAVRKTKTGSVQQRKDSTLVDMRYVEANANWIEARVYHDLLENIEEAARRDLRTISRLIETQKMSFDAGRRVTNAAKPGTSGADRYRTSRPRRKKT